MLRPVALCLSILLLCSGCYGAKETDAVAYILVIGIDKTDNPDLERVTYQIAVPRALETNGESLPESGGEEPWILTSLSIPSPAEARALLSSTMSRSPEVNHITAYIFSEELARQGLGKSISFLMRSRDYRETIYFIVVQGSAEEYIKKNKPVLETNISRYYELIFASSDEGGYFLSTLHNFYSRLKNRGGSPYVSYSGINPLTGEDKPAGGKTPEQKGDPYLPGGIPRTGEEAPIDFIGLAVFQDDKMVGTLNSDEARSVALLQGLFSRGYVGIVDPLRPEKDFINLNIRCMEQPRIAAVLKGNKAAFTVSVKLDGEIRDISSGINYEANGYRQLLETQTANLFKGQIQSMLRHTQALGSDPVGFGLYLRPAFADTTALQQADFTELYRNADIQVNVTVNIRRTGLLWRTSPIRQ
ncbi:MAG: Ger(x)C family spore germination protein [Sporomusaceae bacterium]|nr:Ger(x)C family spore germination protein [Sporomusaceae bacterium]